MTQSIPDFIHLHVHTQYSLLDGAIRIEPLLARTDKFGMNSVAVTDHGTMFGTIDFYQKAVKVGIKPIIGCECYVAPRTIRDKTPLDKKGLSHLILLAKNQEGYRNLCRLVTIAQLKGFYYKPRIDKELLKQYHKGLIALSACLQGEIPKRICEDNMIAAEAAAREYIDIFGEKNYFFEIQSNGISHQEKVNQALLEMSGRMSIPLVASNDCHYLDSEDVKAHDVLLCIQTGKTVNDANRLKFRTDQLYFKPKEQMYSDFKDFPNAITNSAAIAERCNVELTFGVFHFPKFDTESESSVEEIFDRKVKQGFERILENMKIPIPDLKLKNYIDRLAIETDIIKQMEFCGYFLIVADFISYAKQNKIPVGPGRGSAAGSLVAYSLGITDIDPLSYGLIFERFLNPARKSMPDIDVDFCINGREDVFKYVVDRYGGGEYVAQIITFGKMKTRAVIRDVGRALDIPLREVDTIAKLVPDVLNISLDNALKQEPRLADIIKKNKNIANLINVCRVLEGLPRHASTHAAGVVIADKPLVEYLPLYRGKKGEIVTQYDMVCVEKIGLVKFDFLGLRNLTVIDNTLRLIAEQRKTPPDLENLDLADADTYKLLSSGNTAGVFQLESSGMKDLLVRLRPESFHDVIALVALYRPGPLDSGMVDDFVERKHGRKNVEYLVPELEKILNETYGVIVYQEQVMKIAGELADYTMAEADDLRKAMGKKIPAIMAKHRERFVKGASRKGIPAGKAVKIFNLMEKFGGYGFNKSHSAAYALIAYQTAYLKTHFPVEILAALLTSEMHSTDGVVKYIAECQNRGIEILPPNINESAKTFTVTSEKIRFGLVAVKNVGEGAIESIISMRQKGKFQSLFDFCERVELKKVNKRVIESLIKCGAFDGTGEYRSRLMVSLEDAIEYGQRIQRERSDPQMGLFDVQKMGKKIANYPPIPEIDEWDEKQRLTYEKGSLGFFISGNPLDRYKKILEKFTNTNTLLIKEKKDGQRVCMGGVIQNIKVIKAKTGLMAFVNLEDINGSVEVTVFPKQYTLASGLLTNDNIILVNGNLQKDENNVKVLAENIIAIDKAEEKWVATIHLHMDVALSDRDSLIQLRDTLVKADRGSCRVYLHLKNSLKTEIIISFPDTIKLKPGAELTDRVNGLLGYNAMETVADHTMLSNTGNNNKIRKRRF